MFCLFYEFERPDSSLSVALVLSWPLYIGLLTSGRWCSSQCGERIDRTLRGLKVVRPRPTFCMSDNWAKFFVDFYYHLNAHVHRQLHFLPWRVHAADCRWIAHTFLNVRFSTDSRAGRHAPLFYKDYVCVSILQSVKFFAD